MLLAVFMQDLSDVRVTDEIVDGAHGVVAFEGTIDGRSIEVLTLVRHDEAGLVQDLRIFLRPLGAMAVAAEVVMTHMADRMNSPGPRTAIRAAQAVRRIKGASPPDHPA
jgi:hypothetical protein